MEKLIFQQDFIKECFQAYQYSTNFDWLLSNLQLGNSANVRSEMDFAIDELQEEINQPIGQGEESIHNARVDQLRNRYKCWYKLLELLENEPRTIGLLQERGS